MPTRRQALVALAAVGLAGCGTSRHPTAAGGALAMTCPPVTPGSVTGETGTLNGVPLTFEDAYALKQGTSFQWQWYAGLSSVAGVGVRYPQNKTVQGERWLLLTLVGGHPGDPANMTTVSPPAASQAAPFVINVGTPIYQGQTGTPDYVVYTLNPSFASHNGQCRQTTQTPTGGSVSYTKFDTTGIEGSYDLNFGADHVTGDFAGPNLDLTGCPARPSKVTCVTA